MKHHFRGYIAGLSVLLGENEKPEVLSCLHKCKETLEVPSVKLLEPGMELITNSGRGYAFVRPYVLVLKQNQSDSFFV